MSQLDEIIPPEIRDDKFYFLIQRLAREERLHNVLEIGSSAGGGSTEAFVTGIQRNANPPRLFCLEVSKPRFLELSERYRPYPFVHCYNASSVPIESFPKPEEVRQFYLSKPTNLNQYPLEQVLGWLTQDISYIKNSGSPENGIQLIKAEHNIEYFDLVLIDGSAFTGMAELKEIYGAGIILLDDVNDIKCFDAYVRLRQDPAYELIEEDLVIRNGYAAFRRVGSDKRKIPTKDLSISSENSGISSQADLPIHFFTIVLNGEPFIRHHIEVLKGLPFPWHWHIIEGVADFKNCTAWGMQNGGSIPPEMHSAGRSNDGTSQYLDGLTRSYPERVTLYRKPLGEFWEGKLEMINAPLDSIREECLLWQIDSDELWTREQLIEARRMFVDEPTRRAAYYRCHYFVGPDLVTATRDSYGNHSSFEWLRSWRFKPGNQWICHEPPTLCEFEGEKAVDLASKSPFMHDETEQRGLTFQHYAYAEEKQLQFKESYYGYRSAVEGWKSLQRVRRFPVFLQNYFPWVDDHTTVDRAVELGVEPLAKRNVRGEWRFFTSGGTGEDVNRILFVRTDSIGDVVLAQSMLPHLRRRYPRASVTVVCQQHLAELFEHDLCVDEIVAFDKARAIHEEKYLNGMLQELRKKRFDVALNTVLSSEPLTHILTLGSGAKAAFGFKGLTDNIDPGEQAKLLSYYSHVIEPSPGSASELSRHDEFLSALGSSKSDLVTKVWTTEEDEDFADRVFSELGVDPRRTIGVAAVGQQDFKSCPALGLALGEALKDKGYHLLALGDKKGFAVSDGVLKESNLPGTNLCGRTTLRQAASLIKRMPLVVGVDTGLMHLAVGVETPQVVVLGGGHYGRFFPYSPLTSLVTRSLDCFGCGWQCSQPDRYECISQIKATDLAKAITAAIDRKSLQTPTKQVTAHSVDLSSKQPDVAFPKTSAVQRRNVASVPVPIVFIHKGDASYLPYSVVQAKKYNSDSPVYLVSDLPQPALSFIHHVPIGELLGDDTRTEWWRATNPSLSEDDIFRLQRWFLLRDLMKRAKMESCLYLDSDVLLFCSVNSKLPLFSGGDFSLSKGYSPHTMFIKSSQLLDQLCSFLRESAHMLRSGEGQGSDRNIFPAFVTRSGAVAVEATTIMDGKALNHSIGDSELGYRMKDGRIDVTWRENQPYAFHISSRREVKLDSLHFSGDSKRELPEYFY